MKKIIRQVKKTSFVFSVLALSVLVFSSANARTVHLVSVGGHDSVAFGHEDANYSFTARITDTGEVSGEYQDTLADSNGAVHGVITCTVVEGNKAWVGGIITKGIEGNPTYATGMQFLSEVEDNGKNISAPYDRISYTIGAQASDCNKKPDLPLNDMPDGQVTIKSKL